MSDDFEIETAGRGDFDVGELYQFEGKPGTWECWAAGGLVGQKPKKTTYRFTQAAWFK